MTEKRWQVWSGALTASPGRPQPGDQWVDCQVVEVLNSSFYIVVPPGGSALWVPYTHVRLDWI